MKKIYTLILIGLLAAFTGLANAQDASTENIIEQDGLLPGDLLAYIKSLNPDYKIITRQDINPDALMITGAEAQLIHDFDNNYRPDYALVIQTSSEWISAIVFFNNIDGYDHQVLHSVDFKINPRNLLESNNGYDLYFTKGDYIWHLKNKHGTQVFRHGLKVSRLNEWGINWAVYGNRLQEYNDY